MKKNQTLQQLLLGAFLIILFACNSSCKLMLLKNNIQSALAKSQIDRFCKFDKNKYL